MGKKGLCFAGTLTVDIIKMIDVYPEPTMLSYINSVSPSTGGCASTNALAAKKLRPELKVRSLGRVGGDDNGRIVIDKLTAAGVDVSGIRVSPKELTSFSDVFTVEGTGVRTFFHSVGTNATFCPEDIDMENLDCDVFHIGYALLHETMDSPDPECGTVMAHVLRDVSAKGIKTALDVVTASSDDYRRVVVPSLKYTDYLIFNETEGSRTTGIEVRSDDGKIIEKNMKLILAKLIELGVRELVVVHSPEGAWAMDKEGRYYSTPSVKLPKGYIKGSVGAGDCFCVGTLLSIYEGFGVSEAIWRGACVAAASLSSADAVGGITGMEDAVRRAEEFGKLDFDYAKE